MASHGLIGGDIFGMHALRLFDQFLLDAFDGADAEGFKFLGHAADRPEQVDGSGARLADGLADLVEIFLEVGAGLGFGILHAERYAHGGGYAYGRGSADYHVADHVGDLLVRGAGYVDFFGGQLRLIDEAYAAGGPFESVDHSSVVSGWWIGETLAIN